MFRSIASRLARRPPREYKKKLSVIVVCYKMYAQIGNTIQSLIPPYQRGLKFSDYEILLVDNGSPKPLPDELQKASKNLRYIYIPPGEACPNPGVAINRAVKMSKGAIVCLMIDGARMVTPAALSWGMRLVNLVPRAIAEVRGWHLGPKIQPESIKEGYCPEIERELLVQSRWWENGYNLFDICAPSEQTRKGFSGPTAESNCIFMERELFDELNGMEEAFSAPGGGLVNLDFFERAVKLASKVFTVLGEGTFHQVHGGAATGKVQEELDKAFAVWAAEAAKIRGRPIGPVDHQQFVVAGHLPEPCLRWLLKNGCSSVTG